MKNKKVRVNLCVFFKVLHHCLKNTLRSLRLLRTLFYAIGFVTAKDLGKLTGSSAVQGDPGTANESLSLSAFSNLLSDNLKDQYFPKGKVIYKEGEIGNSMLFINSGKLEVNTKDGCVSLSFVMILGELAMFSLSSYGNPCLPLLLIL